MLGSSCTYLTQTDVNMRRTKIIEDNVFMEAIWLILINDPALWDVPYTNLDNVLDQWKKSGPKFYEKY